MAERKTRLLPFVYSADIAYVVELGNEYARFFYDGAVLTNDDSAEVWIQTPYQTADLFQIQYQQRGDTMWLVHPSYAPRKLTRTDVAAFSLDVIEFRGGPFLLRNDLLDPDNPSTTTLACSTTALGFSGLLTATAEVFLPGHDGALFKLIHPRETTTITQNGAGESDTLPVKGTWTFMTHGTWTGTVTIQRQENGGSWEQYRKYIGKNDRNVQLAATEDADNVLYKIVIESASGIGTELSVDTAITEGIVRITAVINAFNAACDVIQALESTDATIKWAEGAWSGVRGYPSTIAFFEDRAVYGGASLALEDTEYSTADYPQLRIT